MGEKSGRSRDFQIAQGALRGKIHAISKSRLQNGNCCILVKLQNIMSITLLPLFIKYQ